MSRDISPRESGNNKQRLAAALRALSVEVVSCAAPEEALVQPALAIEGFCAGLAGRPRRLRRVGVCEGNEAEAGRMYEYGIMDLSPLSGKGNPLSPPMRIKRKDMNCVVAKVIFPASYEGPPGFVHGGFVAAAFDEVMGAAQANSDMPGMTGILTVTYRQPCPLHTELHLEGRVVRVRGRHVFAESTLHGGDELIADAEGVFFKVDRKEYQRYAEARER